jgi:hypothetical protein
MYWFVNTQPDENRRAVTFSMYNLPMLDQPLVPFAPPTALLSYLKSGFITGNVLIWILCGVYVFWAVYTVVTIYHWKKYSHASTIAFPAIAFHLFVSISLMIYAVSNAMMV